MFDSIAGALVGALVGGLIAWGVAYWQFNRSKDVEAHGTSKSRAHDARLAVEAVVSKLEDSELYRVDPHYEIWDKGFSSMNQTRILFQAAKGRLRTIGNSDVLALVEKLETAHRPIIQLRDSFDLFMAKKNVDGVQRIAMAHEWPDVDRAADELRRLQTFVHLELRALKELAAARLGNA